MTASTAYLTSCLAGGLVPGRIYFVGLHTADPGSTGMNEVAGSPYARSPVAAPTPVNGLSQFPTVGVPVPASAAPSYLALWDSAAGGTYLVSGPLTAGTYSTEDDLLSVRFVVFLSRPPT